MNWVVYGQKQTITEEWDHCEHLKVGDVAPYMAGEQELFGPVTRIGMCKECHEKHKEEQEQELELCRDCGQEKPMKEMREWRMYDFDHRQGDEPLIICDDCSVKEKHKERVRKDNEAYEWEMGDGY